MTMTNLRPYRYIQQQNWGLKPEFKTVFKCDLKDFWSKTEILLKYRIFVKNLNFGHDLQSWISVFGSKPYFGPRSSLAPPTD